MIEPLEYLGQRLSTAELETLAFNRMSLAQRSQEAELYTYKWFDYRPMHPVKATYLFAATYQAVAQHFYAQVKDAHEAPTVRSFNPEDVFKCREISGFVNARQAYDRLGVRYAFGLHFTFSRFIDRGWRAFPRPNQLYNEECLLDLQDAWVEECAARLQMPVDPRFQNVNYTAHPDQLAWRAWARREVDRRADKFRALSSLFVNRVYPEPLAVESFGAQTTAQARRIAELVLKSQ